MEPCGECHLKPGETCDICGRKRRSTHQVIARGLLPDGLDVKTLTPQGRQELRDAIDALLNL